MNKQTPDNYITDIMYEEYQVYESESKACGYEYISWTEWKLNYVREQLEGLL
tara:strand:+ start:58 stop:213 length:156 start_codon:yes stop_codon:yes gene_type:complete